jgi:integrase
MSRKTDSTPSSIADGVRIRTYKSGLQRLELQFQYRGIQCREILTLPITKANTQYAKNLKIQIEEAKAKGTFTYREFFPESPRCQQFGEIGPADPTVKEALEQWKIDIEKAHEKSTARTYKKSANYCIQQLGKYKITDLEQNPEPIRDMIRNRSGTLKTIRNDLTPLRAIFDAATEDDIIKRNPMDRIKVNKLANSRKQSTYVVDPLSLPEILLFLQTAEIYRPRWKNYFQFAFFTGLRPSELYALRWRDIDMTKQQASVKSAVVERFEKGTKTAAGTRRVDLAPMALTALIDEYNQSAVLGKGRAGNDHVFWNPVLKRPITDYDHSGRAWLYIETKAAIRHRNQYQHRHSYCSNMLSGGENIFYMATQMGHVDTEMITKHYAKWIEQGQATTQRREFTSPFGRLES